MMRLEERKEERGTYHKMYKRNNGSAPSCAYCTWMVMGGVMAATNRGRGAFLSSNRLLEDGAYVADRTGGRGCACGRTRLWL